jgi:hypothetical protein
MSEIVKRLLAPAYWISGSAEGHEGENNAPREAADEITRLKAEVARLKTCGIVEVAAHNPSVMDWIKHWEDRTLKAEAVLDAVRRAIPDAYILDPPDGGDVSTVEGVTRLKTEVERKDAALLVARDCIEESFSHAKTPDDLLMAEARLRDVDAALTPSQEPRT